MAMNALKARAAKRFAGIAQPADLFPWTNAGSKPDAGPYDGLPAYYNSRSVGHLLAFSVAGLTGIATAASVSFLELAQWNRSIVWHSSAIYGLSAFVMGMLMYRHWLTLAQRERDARG